jgi:hypothetical protein
VAFGWLIIGFWDDCGVQGRSDDQREILDAESDVVKPAPTRSAVPGGFTVDDFTVDHTARTVTCPAGATRNITGAGNAIFKSACRGCALRARCTTSVNGKSLHLQPHDALQT